MISPELTIATALTLLPWIWAVAYGLATKAPKPPPPDPEDLDLWGHKRVGL